MSTVYQHVFNCKHVYSCYMYYQHSVVTLYLHIDLFTIFID